MFTSFAGTIVRDFVGSEDLLFQESNVASN